MLRWLFRIFTHALAIAIGFALGVYMLPILTAPPGPAAGDLKAAMQASQFKGKFERSLKGSDFLHWGEGEVSVSKERIAHEGRLAPGPDYKVYLTKSFVDTRDGFRAIKKDAALVGDVKTFNGFILAVPPGVDVADYTTVVVWCESFGAFISAAKYR